MIDRLPAKERDSAWELPIPLASTDETSSNGEPAFASVLELANRFYDSEHGNHMANNQVLRYSHRYGYDRATMAADLGDDVNPIGHMRDLMHHLQLVVDTEYDEQTLFAISDEEYAILAFACAIHDIGETEHPNVLAAGIDRVVGDLPAGTKTPDDKIAEATIRQYLYREFYSDVDPAIINRVEAIISHTDDTHLHDIYETAHSLQSLATTKQAEEIIFRDWLCCINNERDKALKGMVEDVRTESKWMGSVGIHLFAAEEEVSTLSYQRPMPDCSGNPCPRARTRLATLDDQS